MKIKFRPTATEQDAVAMIKIAIFCLPVTVIQFFGAARKDHLIVGLTVIFGVFLQALIPPRKKLLVPLLILSVGFTMLYSVFWN